MVTRSTLTLFVDYARRGLSGTGQVAYNTNTETPLPVAELGLPVRLVAGNNQQILKSLSLFSKYSWLIDCLPISSRTFRSPQMLRRLHLINAQSRVVAETEALFYAPEKLYDRPSTSNKHNYTPAQLLLLLLMKAFPCFAVLGAGALRATTRNVLSQDQFQ